MREPRPGEQSTEQTRRTVLAGGAVAALGALAGCSSLPVVGDEEPKLGFDPATLPSSFLDPLPARPVVYPGPVPSDRHAHHRQRARALLDEVPRDPSFPNGAVSNRLAEMRRRVARNVREGPDEMERTPLERLGHWRSARSKAAEVWGVYQAAQSDIDADWISSRRADVRQRAQTFEAEWRYPGADLVSAVAANQQFEELLTTCRQYLDPRRPTPEEPRAAVFAMGRLVNDIEHAQATLDDLIGLHDSYRASLPSGSSTNYRDTVAIAAHRLKAVAQESQRQVERYTSDDAGPSDFAREIDGLPAEELFFEAKQRVRSRREELKDAIERGDDATAVVVSGRLTVTTLALMTVVDAIRDGQYGIPDSLADVKAYRNTAVTAVQQITNLEPQPLAMVLGASAWNPLEKVTYGFRERHDEDTPADQRDVVRMIAGFALATHLARSVPEVTLRFDKEIPALNG